MSASDCATGPPRDFGIRPGPPVLPLGVVRRAQTRGALRPSTDGQCAKAQLCLWPSGLLTNQACFHPFVGRGDSGGENMAEGTQGPRDAW